MNAGEKPLSDRDIDDILALFAQPDLTVQEAEEAIERLRIVRRRVVERLLDTLHTPQAQGADKALLSEGERTSEGGHDDRDAALILLTYLGDESLVPRLLALLDDESVSDDLKLKLISVIHELDPEADSEALLGRLRNPYKAMHRSQHEHLQRLRSPLELALWLEMMAEQMPPQVRISFARSSAEIDDASAVPLLICMCYDPDDDVALAAIDAVERYKDARALPALEELGGRYPSAPVRTEARKAADRLRIRASLAPQVEPVPPPPLYACYLTTIDGSGGQVAILTRRTSKETLRLVEVIFGDNQGIEQCFGTDVYVDELDDMLDELVAQGISPVQVTHGQWMAALDMACETTWQAGQPLPASFVAWREWIAWERENEGSAGAPAAEPFAASIPVEERDQLLHACHELLFQDEFVHWFFNVDEIGDLDDVYWTLVGEEGQAPDGPALRALLRQGVHEIVTDQVRSQIRDRLRRVAPLLCELYEDREVWQWAVVAADALADDSPLPPEEHPLLLAMVACSLENAVGEAIDWFTAI